MWQGEGSSGHSLQNDGPSRLIWEGLVGEGESKKTTRIAGDVAKRTDSLSELFNSSYSELFAPRRLETSAQVLDADTVGR